MTKKELEIRCEIMQERLNKINKICEGYTDISKAPETIGAIITLCDPDFLEQCTSWRL